MRKHLVSRILSAFKIVVLTGIYNKSGRVFSTPPLLCFFFHTDRYACPDNWLYETSLLLCCYMKFSDFCPQCFCTLRSLRDLA